MSKDDQIRILEDTLDSLLTEMSADVPDTRLTLPGQPVQRNPRDVNSASWAMEREAGKMDVLRKIRQWCDEKQSAAERKDGPSDWNTLAILREIRQVFNLNNI